MLQTEPIEVPYERYRSKDKGYVIRIVGVYHTQVPNGWVTLIKAIRQGEARIFSWPGKTFYRYFEPVGRKLRVPTRWERLRRKDKF